MKWRRLHISAARSSLNSFCLALPSTAVVFETSLDFFSILATVSSSSAGKEDRDVMVFAAKRLYMTVSTILWYHSAQATGPLHECRNLTHHSSLPHLEGRSRVDPALCMLPLAARNTVGR